MIFRRLILKEILLPFAAWIGFICALLLALAFVRSSEILLGSALNRSDVIRFGLFLLPGFVVQALPAAFLAALFLGLGRLSEDGELRALQSLGVSPLRIATGPLMLGVGLSVVLALLLATVQPASTTGLRATVRDVLRRNLTTDFVPGEVHEEIRGVAFYAERAANPTALSHVFMYDDRDSDRPLLVLAREGAVSAEPGSEGLRFTLQDGEVHRANTQQHIYEIIRFEMASFVFGLENVYRERGQFRVAREEESPAALMRLATQASAEGKNPRQYWSAFHWKLGQMLMPLAFAFIATPIAFGRSRGRRATSVWLSLATYVGYFLLARLSGQIGDSGLLPPALSGQLPNLIAIGAGVLLMRHQMLRGAA